MNDHLFVTVIVLNRMYTYPKNILNSFYLDEKDSRLMLLVNM